MALPSVDEEPNSGEPLGGGGARESSERIGSVLPDTPSGNPYCGNTSGSVKGFSRVMRVMMEKETWPEDP